MMVVESNCLVVDLIYDLVRLLFVFLFVVLSSSTALIAFFPA